MYSRFKSSVKKQQGNMLVMAMFAMVILSLLGISMATLLTSSERTIVNEVLGERAEQASRAGLEILIYAIHPANDSTIYICNASFNLTRFSTLEGMEGCSVVVRCDTRDVSFSGGRDWHYEAKSTATCSAGDFTAVKTNTRSMTRRQNY